MQLRRLPRDFTIDWNGRNNGPIIYYLESPRITRVEFAWWFAGRYDFTAIYPQFRILGLIPEFCRSCFRWMLRDRIASPRIINRDRVIRSLAERQTVIF